jgi:hypothetical protein
MIAVAGILTRTANARSEQETAPEELLALVRCDVILSAP